MENKESGSMIGEAETKGNHNILKKVIINKL